jgi:hypothetical protein
MSPCPGGPVLTFRRRPLAVFIALIALCVAQSVAMAHALSHLGSRDQPTAPGQHGQVCTDCVSHASLLVTGGAAAVVLFLAFHAFSALRPHAIRAPAGRAVHYAFRSRAPPR